MPGDAFTTAVEALVFRDAKGGSARLMLGAEGEVPVLTVATTSAKGRVTQRVNKPKVRHAELGGWDEVNLIESVVRALLRKGMTAVAERRGAPDLVLGTAVGPPMGAAFAVDAERNLAWLGDWGFLRRVDLATGAVESFSLGECPGVREVVAAKDGSVWVFAEHDVTSSPEVKFLPPSSAQTVRFGVFRFAGRALEPFSTLAYPRLAEGPPLIGWSLGVAGDGTALVPSLGGVAHVDASGKLLRLYPVTQAAISTSGRFVAALSKGRIEVFDLRGGASIDLNTDADLVGAELLEVDDEGTVDVATRASFQRLPLRGDPVRIKAGDGACYAVSPDRQRVYACIYSGVEMRDGKGEKLGRLRSLSGYRGEPIVATQDAVFVRNSLGVFQRLSL